MFEVWVDELMERWYGGWMEVGNRFDYEDGTWGLVCHWYTPYSGDFFALRRKPSAKNVFLICVRCQRRVKGGGDAIGNNQAK